MSAGQLVHATAANGFNTAELTAMYECGRPTYNTQLIQELLTTLLDHHQKFHPEKKNLVIVDLAAGTGISTRALLSNLEFLQKNKYSQLSFKIFAVEPVDAMRAKLAETLQQHPSNSSTIKFEVLQGTAQHIPLPEHTVDFLFAFQSFHWFSHREALAEFHRVLVQNGALAVVWNVRSRSVVYSSQIEDIIDECYEKERQTQGSEIPRQSSGKWREAFENQPYFTTPLEERITDVGIVQRGTIDVVLNRTLSISVVNQRSQQEKDDIVKRVRHIIENSPDIPDKNNIELPNATEIYITFAK